MVFNKTGRKDAISVNLNDVVAVATSEGLVPDEAFTETVVFVPDVDERTGKVFLKFADEFPRGFAASVVGDNHFVRKACLLLDALEDKLQGFRPIVGRNQQGTGFRYGFHCFRLSEKAVSGTSLLSFCWEQSCFFEDRVVKSVALFFSCCCNEDVGWSFLLTHKQKEKR